jgi:hypothetical protein
VDAKLAVWSMSLHAELKINDLSRKGGVSIDQDETKVANEQ